ncbi:MAG: galactose mutarotase [Clostridia bacterium]|nr:galactose mutarotase [Clostridia bacterium]
MKTTLFGKLGDTAVYAHTLSSENTTVTIIDYGARIASLTFKGVSCVCGFSDMAGYLADNDYHGSIVGRYANRISEGKFTLNGKEYTLALNEKDRCHLHGGKVGYSNRIWTPVNFTENSITLSLFSPDSEEGYPGNLYITVTYTLKNDALSIDYTAKTDADTVINLTNHAYFNIGGVGKESVHDQTLTLYADAIAEVTEILVPSGKMIPTAGGAFDFTQPKTIGRDIANDDVQLKMGGGYDHGFRLTQNAPCAILHSETSGITMEIDTTEGGIQIYTGNFMTADNPFFGTIPQTAGGAVALECNKLPDSPNRPEFPSCVLKAGETYTQTTTYRFY